MTHFFKSNEQPYVRLIYSDIPVLPVTELKLSLQRAVHAIISQASLPVVVFLCQSKNTWARVVLQSKSSCNLNNIDDITSTSTSQLTFNLNGVELSMCEEATVMVVGQSIINGLHARWMCPVCEAEIMCLSEKIIDHIRSHMEKWLCFYCDAELTGRLQHFCPERRKSKPVCPLCKLTFSSAQKLNNHQLACHVERPTCHQCQLEFRSASLLLQHLQVRHHGQTVNKCDKCSKVFKTVNQLTRHQRDVHPMISHPCQQCQATFKTHSNLQVHIREQHSGIMPNLVCDQCDKCFKQKRNLIRHINSDHKAVKAQRKIKQPGFSVIYYEQPSDSL